MPDASRLAIGATTVALASLATVGTGVLIDNGTRVLTPQVVPPPPRTASSVPPPRALFVARPPGTFVPPSPRLPGPAVPAVALGPAQPGLGVGHPGGAADAHRPLVLQPHTQRTTTVAPTPTPTPSPTPVLSPTATPTPTPSPTHGKRGTHAKPAHAKPPHPTHSPHEGHDNQR